MSRRRGISHLPQLGYAISAGFMGLFGDDLFGLRTASVFLGTASVLLVYFLTKRLFSPRIAAVAAFLLAVSHWHIHFSRSGIHYMQGSFATLLLFVLLLRGIDGGRRVDFLLAGFAIGNAFKVRAEHRAHSREYLPRVGQRHAANKMNVTWHRRS
jgi:4-amino-4-deoxy-L-arabinose transferase-like glycosyltransferase